MRIAIVAAVVVGMTFSAQAATRSDCRQARQQVRIQRGVRSGELTTGERRALRAEQRYIRRVERRAKSDGAYTACERARVERKQNRASRHIWRSKHN